MNKFSVGDLVEYKFIRDKVPINFTIRVTDALPGYFCGTVETSNHNGRRVGERATCLDYSLFELKTARRDAKGRFVAKPKKVRAKVILEVEVECMSDTDLENMEAEAVFKAYSVDNLATKSTRVLTAAFLR